ncbi:unnamed protein product [Caretta caretta]
MPLKERAVSSLIDQWSQIGMVKTVKRSPTNCPRPESPGQKVLKAAERNTCWLKGQRRLGKRWRADPADVSRQKLES